MTPVATSGEEIEMDPKQLTGDPLSDASEIWANVALGLIAFLFVMATACLLLAAIQLNQCN